MFWLWMPLTFAVMITSHITRARGDKRLPRALLEAMVANLIFGALLALRCKQISITHLAAIDWRASGSPILIHIKAV